MIEGVFNSSPHVQYHKGKYCSTNNDFGSKLSWRSSWSSIVFWHWIWKEHLKKRRVLLFLLWMIGYNAIIFLAKWKEHWKKHPVSFNFWWLVTMMKLSSSQGDRGQTVIKLEQTTERDQYWLMSQSTLLSKLTKKSVEALC